MGYFAYTCAVSGLPIDGGDKVRALLLTKNPFHRDNQAGYSWDSTWVPRTMPIRATYNDYGSIEDEEKDVLRDLWLAGLQIDGSPETKTLNFKELLSGLREQDGVTVRAGSVQLIPGMPPEFVETTTPKQLPVSLGMIREDVWNALLSIKFPLGWSERKSITFENYQQAIRRVSKNLKFYGSMPDLPSSTELDRIIYFAFCSNFPFTVSIPDHIRLLQDNKKPLPAPVLTALAEFGFVSEILKTTRFQWRQPSSAGPQDGHWGLHVSVQEQLLKIAKTQYKAWKATDE